VPEDILRFWIGHAVKFVTDRYSKMKQRLNSRKEWAEKVGAGFSYLAPIYRQKRKLETPRNLV